MQINIKICVIKFISCLTIVRIHTYEHRTTYTGQETGRTNKRKKNENIFGFDLFAALKYFLLSSSFLVLLLYFIRIVPLCIHTHIHTRNNFGLGVINIIFVCHPFVSFSFPFFIFYYIYFFFVFPKRFLLPCSRKFVFHPPNPYMSYVNTYTHNKSNNSNNNNNNMVLTAEHHE